MEIRRYLTFLRRRWWLLLLGPALAAVSAYFVTEALTPIYRANTELLLINQTGGPNTIQLNDILTNERLTNTYVELVKRRPILEAVIASLKLPLSPEQLDKKISVSPVAQTQLINISVEDPSAALAANIADTTASEFIKENDRQIGRPGTVSVAEAATPPLHPSKPSLKTNLILAVVLGLIVSGSLSLALDYLDDTVKGSEDLEPFGLTTLGVVSRFKRPAGKQKGRKKAAAWMSPLEDYRDLRTNIHFVDLESNLNTIVVTSHGPGEGKSTTAANLALVLAQAGDKVILVDTDLRRPALHDIIGTPNSFGLTGLLLSDVDDPSEALLTTDVPNLMFLPSGPLPPNPSELLTSKRMARIVLGLRSLADFVIFDSPPVATVTDASILSGMADGVVLVIEVRRTRIGSVNQAMRSLQNVRAKVIGAVINKQKHSRARYRYASYGQAPEGESAGDEVRLSSDQPEPAKHAL